MSILAGRIIRVAAGTAKNVDLSSARATVWEQAGATATVSLVESLDATAHSSETITVASNLAEIATNWPFIRVSAAGGDVLVGLNWR